MSNNQDRDQTGDKNQKASQTKQHDDVQGGGGGSAGGGGQTKHAEGTQSEHSGRRTGTRTKDNDTRRGHAE